MLNLFVTLWPSFPHFDLFANHNRIAGIRLNSAMISNPELEAELHKIQEAPPNVPLYFDAKGKQLRVTEVVDAKNDHLEIILNHPINVRTPAIVLFKAGADHALLQKVMDGGTRLVFKDGPKYSVLVGESLHIPMKRLKVSGDTFTKTEKEKIEKVRKAGFKKYFLSYVECQEHIDEFRELVGTDSEIMLKLEFVEKSFKKSDNLKLVAARGDLYIEVDRPHHILEALRLIVQKDQEACVGSRIFLSIIRSPVPECCDFCELAWLADIGYKNFMLCDEICLKKDLLSSAVNAFCAFRANYKPSTLPT